MQTGGVDETGNAGEAKDIALQQEQPGNHTYSNNWPEDVGDIAMSFALRLAS
jgi:hypothetical protein